MVSQSDSHTVAQPRIYTRRFWMVCTSSLLFFASFNMLIPELPDYLTSLGGADYKGLIISLFTITAMLSRPFSGKLADSIGRVPVMLAGSLVCVVCSLVYPVLATVSGFLWLRLFHGFSTGFTPTGQAALISDIIPASRRGEAMGILGTAGTLGMALGPAIGGWLGSYFSVNAVFYTSAASAVLSVSIVLNVRDTLHHRQRFNLSLLRVTASDFFEPRVFAPCMVMILCAFAYGALYTILPDLGAYMGVENKGILFAYFTIASLVVRLIGGKASDHFGRKPVLQFSTTLIVIGMSLIAFADHMLVLILGVVLYGFGQGTTSPTLLAWATDLSDANNKGRGIASLYIFMELGIGLGAFLSAWIYDNNSNYFLHTFVLCAGLAATSFFYLLFVKSKPAL